MICYTNWEWSAKSTPSFCVILSIFNAAWSLILEWIERYKFIWLIYLRFVLLDFLDLVVFIDRLDRFFVFFWDEIERDLRDFVLDFHPLFLVISLDFFQGII